MEGIDQLHSGLIGCISLFMQVGELPRGRRQKKRWLAAALVIRIAQCPYALFLLLRKRCAARIAIPSAVTVRPYADSVCTGAAGDGVGGLGGAGVIGVSNNSNARDVVPGSPHALLSLPLFHRRLPGKPCHDQIVVAEVLFTIER